MFGENIFSVWGQHPSPSSSRVVLGRLTLSFLQNSHGIHSGLMITSCRDFAGTFKKGDIIIIIITIFLDCQLFGQCKRRAPVAFSATSINGADTKENSVEKQEVTNSQGLFGNARSAWPDLSAPSLNFSAMETTYHFRVSLV